MSRAPSYDELNKLKHTIATLEVELKTLTIERNQLKANLDYVANELNRMSKLSDTLLNERNSLIAQRSTLISQINALTLERDELNQKLSQLEHEEGLPVDPSVLIAGIQNSIERLPRLQAENSDYDSINAFSIQNLSIDLKGVISKDGKIILPYTFRLAPERISTISFVLQQDNSMFERANSSGKEEEDDNNLIMMPNLINFSQERAQEMLRSFGLEPDDIVKEPTMSVPAGTVLGHEPPAGTRIPYNSKVKLAVSIQGTDKVPSVVNMTLEDSLLNLVQTGWQFRIIPVNTDHPSPELGRIVKQEPAEGQIVVKSHTHIQLMVNLLHRPLEEIGTVIDPSTIQILNQNGIKSLADLAFRSLPAILGGLTEEVIQRLKRIAALMVFIKEVDRNIADILVTVGGISSIKGLAGSNAAELYKHCRENYERTSSPTTISSLPQDYFEKEFTPERLEQIISSAKTLYQNNANRSAS
jgi:PASTA domain/Domain of unknown function (DUF4332)